MSKIQRALISVYDKTGLGALVMALILHFPNIKIISTGGTYGIIKKMLGEDKAAINLVEVSEYTGQPEAEGGLVKSLHHKLFLGYLTETYCEAHQADLKRENAVPVDLVVINLYPFQKVVVGDPSFEEARGNIDVGGPSALRAAAKNFLRVMTLTDPLDYISFSHDLIFLQSQTSLSQRFIAASKTFKILGEYDTAIAKYFARARYAADLEKCYQIASDPEHLEYSGETEEEDLKE